MNDRLKTKLLQAQARRIQKENPEIYEYLVSRDETTAMLFREVMNSIPNPDDFPKIRIPFIDVAIEVAKPQDECPICDEEDSLWLTPSLRAKLCDICRNGIYLRRTGIGSLAA